ncbi:MAG: hypothetical protein JST70_04565 [Bacteroidetes bacterium]|nr:hypothetical protein [Bacteroidota bacterium]
MKAKLPFISLLLLSIVACKKNDKPQVAANNANNNQQNTTNKHYRLMQMSRAGTNKITTYNYTYNTDGNVSSVTLVDSTPQYPTTERFIETFTYNSQKQIISDHWVHVIGDHSIEDTIGFDKFSGKFSYNSSGQLMLINYTLDSDPSIHNYIEYIRNNGNNIIQINNYYHVDDGSSPNYHVFKYFITYDASGDAEKIEVRTDTYKDSTTIFPLYSNITYDRSKNYQSFVPGLPIYGFIYQGNFSWLITPSPQTLSLNNASAWIYTDADGISHNINYDFHYDAENHLLSYDDGTYSYSFVYEVY